ncbi:hypothetical protein [Halosegnis longus]|uniref:hypothetical protein n=1 Tax=Halosegnis longus TaxID=2216012 RepID=UPI00129EA7D8|nr:hypothetical protein [Halosegnis longus]
MSQDAGDKSRQTGLSDTFTNSTDATIPAGAAVVVTGENEIAPADVNGAGGDVDAVVDSAIPPGEHGTAHLSGAIWTRLADAVNAGDDAGAPDSSSGDSTPGELEAGGDRPVLETATDTNGVYIGRVLVN